MPRTKASRFLGVYRKHGNARRTWTTQFVIPSGKVASFGSFRTEREAAEAYDRAVLHYRGPYARRNFPEKPLPPADETTLRAEFRRLAKLDSLSKYRGVSKSRSLWRARIVVRGRAIPLGSWPTEVKAAEAHDRAALFAGIDVSVLNFPGRALTATDPAELRTRAHALRKAKTSSSRFRGVRFDGRNGRRPWVARISVPGQGPKELGTWAVEADAARAYDRAARFYLDRPTVLNFPAEKTQAADAGRLRKEARQESKAGHTSRYVGVHWNTREEQWQAVICDKSRRIHLGFYTSERAAAKAYDDKSVELRGKRASVNFNPMTGEPVWGTRLSDSGDAGMDARRT
jgi:hypothetical protein